MESPHFVCFSVKKRGVRAACARPQIIPQHYYNTKQPNAQDRPKKNPSVRQNRKQNSANQSRFSSPSLDFSRNLSYNEEKSHPEERGAAMQSRNKARWILFVLFAAVCIALGSAAGWYLNKRSTEKTYGIQTLTSTTVKEIISPAADLITTKYHYTDSDMYSRTGQLLFIKYTKNKVVFTYSGVVHAGITLSDVTCSVDEASRTIRITLPEPKILAHELDESGFTFYEIKNSVFSKFTMEDYTNLVAEMKQKTEDKLNADESFFRDVTANAQNVIRNFLQNASVSKDYTVEFT